MKDRKFGVPCQAMGRRRGRALLAAWFGLAVWPGIIHAQTPASGQPMPDQPPPQTPSTPAAAQGMETPLPNKVMGQVPFTARYAVAGEITDNLQHLFAFHSPTSGPNSLRARNETELTHTDTLYLGARPTPRFEVYVNPEIALGNGVSSGDGLAGYSNGDLIGQPSLGSGPYLARAFVRWRIPLQHAAAPGQTQDVTPGTNLIGGALPASRLVITGGQVRHLGPFRCEQLCQQRTQPVPEQRLHQQPGL